jgi:NADPH:quinone reductase-like Zn-dependent oxidoreductase
VIWGCDVSGVVEQVGESVTLFKPGDEVHGFKHGKVGETYRGTYAEYAVLPENTLTHKPARLSHEEAAVVPLAATTAWQALVGYGKVKPGSKVLIHAAAGGVGIFAVQIAKSFGAWVAATASERNHELLSQLGADQVIDYTCEKIEDKLSDFDVVLDGVGQPVWSSSLKVLRTGGKLITLTLPTPHAPTGRVKFFGTAIAGAGSGIGQALLRGKAFLRAQVKPRGGDLEKINALMEAGKLKPVIQHVYALEQIAEAHRVSEAEHVTGKLVIKISS